MGIRLHWARLTKRVLLFEYGILKKIRKVLMYVFDFTRGVLTMYLAAAMRAFYCGSMITALPCGTCSRVKEKAPTKNYCLVYNSSVH